LSRIHWNEQSYSLNFEHGQPLYGERSPDRRLLIKFGGCMDIDEFREGQPRYRVISEPPLGRDYGSLFARWNAELPFPMYTVVNDVHEFHVLNFMHYKKGRKQLKINGDEYLQNTRQFPRVSHRVQGRTELQLHFVLMLVGRQQESRPNTEILQEMTRRAALNTESVR
jgi:hypothetical protein